MRVPYRALVLLLLLACAPPPPGVQVRSEVGPRGTALHAASDGQGGLETVAADGEGLVFAKGPGWSAPVRVSTGSVAGGARLALGFSGRRAIVWEDGDERIRVAVSVDGGGTWTPAGLRVSGELPDVAWLPDGRLAVVWPGLGPYGEGPLLLALSSDDGRSFGSPEPLARSAPTACTCCRPALTADRAGNLWVAYRSSVSGVKDLALLRGGDAGFRSLAVPSEPWPMRGCPRDGPSLAVAPDGDRAAVLWSRGADLRYASSPDGAAFTAAVALGAGQDHFAAADASGTLVLGWVAEDGTRLLQVDGPPLPPLPGGAEGSLAATGSGAFTLVVPAP